MRYAFMARKRPQTVWRNSKGEFKAIAIAQTRLKRAKGPAKMPPPWWRA